MQIAALAIMKGMGVEGFEPPSARRHRVYGAARLSNSGAHPKSGRWTDRTSAGSPLASA
jgi:hypothetical protein